MMNRGKHNKRSDTMVNITNDGERRVNRRVPKKQREERSLVFLVPKPNGIVKTASPKVQSHGSTLNVIIDVKNQNRTTRSNYNNNSNNDGNVINPQTKQTVSDRSKHYDSTNNKGNVNSNSGINRYQMESANIESFEHDGTTLSKNVSNHQAPTTHIRVSDKHSGVNQNQMMVLLENPKISPLDQSLMMKAMDPNNVDMFMFFKKRGKEFGQFYKNLEEMHKNIFYVRKSTIQEPLHAIHKTLLEMYLDLFTLENQSLRIEEYFSQTKFDIDKRIRLDIHDLCKSSRIQCRDISNIINKVEELILIVRTKKRYNSVRHCGFQHTTHFYNKTASPENNGRKIVNTSIKENVESNDDDNDDDDDDDDGKFVRDEKKCSKCKIYSYGDIRYLRMSCFYNMSEIGIKDLKHDRENQSYILPICKDCRHDFMFQLLPNWFYQRRKIQETYNVEITPDQMQKFIREFSTLPSSTQ